MKILKVGLCLLDEENNIMCHKPLTSNWSINQDADIDTKIPKLHLIDEICDVLTESIKLEIKSDLVKQMLMEVCILG